MNISNYLEVPILHTSCTVLIFLYCLINKCIKTNLLEKNNTLVVVSITTLFFTYFVSLSYNLLKRFLDCNNYAKNLVGSGPSH